MRKMTRKQLRETVAREIGCRPVEVGAAAMRAYAEEFGIRVVVPALTRSEKNQAMRDLGLVRVRGAQGGVYWE